MQDTRLKQMSEAARAIKVLAQEIQDAADEMLDEGIKDPQGMVHVGSIRQLGAGVHQMAADIANRAGLAEAEPCGNFNTVGSECVRPSGHDSEHRSKFGARWTDESVAVSAAWMAKQMTGRD